MVAFVTSGTASSAREASCGLQGRAPRSDVGPQKSLDPNRVLGGLHRGDGVLRAAVATFLHSIKPVINDVPDPTLAYRTVLASPNFYGGLLYSFTVGSSPSC